ncbi:MAG TPA: SDR family oxidoreductase [Ktedonobacterales bacterium]|jgi:NAD(P)-dependent dehydrogenase (short-subunit alcohol dehydrogenase family)
MHEILNNKTAVVYGAGSIGGAVAAAFAHAGATVFVADQSAEALNKLAGTALRTERLDVLDKDAVAAFVKSVVETTGHVDISFCATATHRPGGEQGAALTELSWEDFALPIIDYTKAVFNTANAVYPYLVKQRSGVIMGMTAVVSQMPLPYTAGFGPAWAAVEAMLRLLAAELGPYGVRTVCLHSAGSEGAADKTLATGNPELDTRTAQWGQRWMSRNLLGRGPTLAEVGHMAAFMASDLAGATTGTTVSLDAGMINQ